MTSLLVTTVPVGTAAFLVLACCLLGRDTGRAPARTSAAGPVRIPAQPGPPDARTSPNPGAAP